jgi:adenylate kinase family enzyme
MQAKKIAVIGINASGKSTFARELAKRTGLPLFHMDNLFWKGKWEVVPEEEYLAKERELVQKPEWIIEGYVDRKEIDRLKAADLIIYLDYSGPRIFWQTIRRWWKHRHVARPELHKDALESISFHNLRLALFRLERPEVEAALRATDQSKIMRFRSPKELQKFVDTTVWT